MICFPLLDKDDKDWTSKAYFANIREKIGDCLKTEFKFCNCKIPGIIYLGDVNYKK